jgi:hypothetical protein
MAYKMIIAKVRYLFFPKTLLFFVLLVFFSLFQGNAQDSFLDDKAVSSFAYDEIPVMVMVEGYPNFYVDAIYANNDLLYVDVAGLFQAIGIHYVIGQAGDSIGGFVENESQEYLISYKSGQVKVGNKIINSNGGLVKEMGTLFMESSLFSESFGLSLTFNYRTLTVIMKAGFELPVIKAQRMEKMRSNISKIQGEVIADTVIQRNYHLFRFGTVDWSLASFQSWKSPTENRIGLGVGAELFHGEADVSVLYYDRKKFDSRELFYLWRWVDNDKKIIKQAQLGRISNQTISFINAPLIGGTIRNSPTTVRKAKGYYTINEYTEPNWTVELYINNVLVDFTKADASGLYVFKVPNVYGYTTLKLKFYGPLGEERTEERTMNVPYTIMPAHGFEYSLSAGVEQDSSLSRFSRGEFNYGANRFITIGGGFEYLSSIQDGALIPFARTTMQPLNKLTITGEYAYGVKTRGLLDYYFWKDALLEIDFTKYVEGQLATRFNALQERKVKISAPFRARRIIGFSKLEYTQFVYGEFNYNVANLMVSAYYKQFSASTSAQINWIDNKSPYAITDLALSYRLGKGYLLRPSAQYNISDGKFILYKAAIEKSIPRGYLTLAYERNILLNDHYLSFNFRFDLSFARTSATVSQSRDHSYTSESAQGSLAFGSGKKHLQTSINSSLGKGGISLYPFLDLNQNGIFDIGEHMVKLTDVRVSGSKAVISEKDSIVRIADLNAFTYFVVEFSDNDLDNIAWRFKNKRYQVLVDPNQYKRVDVPIISVGEVSGMAYMNRDNALKGIGRIQVNFYDRYSSELVAQSLSESDGYINYIGLDLGDYVARVDSAQLSNLDVTVDPQQIQFTIKPSEEGDILGDLDFVLRDKEVQEKLVIDSLPDVVARKDENLFEGGNICTKPGNFYVQCGAFRNKDNAVQMALDLVRKTNVTVGIVFVNDLYKVQVGCVNTRIEANDIKNNLLKEGVNKDLFFKKRE